MVKQIRKKAEGQSKSQDRIDKKKNSSKEKSYKICIEERYKWRNEIGKIAIKKT